MWTQHEGISFLPHRRANDELLFDTLDDRVWGSKVTMIGSVCNDANSALCSGLFPKYAEGLWRVTSPDWAGRQAGEKMASCCCEEAMWSGSKSICSKT